MKRCGFCHTMMQEISRGTLVETHYECPTCGYEDIYGPYRLPDPELLRSRAEELEDLAEQVESSELAVAIERCFG